MMYRRAECHEKQPFKSCGYKSYMSNMGSIVFLHNSKWKERLSKCYNWLAKQKSTTWKYIMKRTINITISTKTKYLKQNSINLKLTWNNDRLILRKYRKVTLFTLLKVMNSAEWVGNLIVKTIPYKTIWSCMPRKSTFVQSCFISQ